MQERFEIDDDALARLQGSGIGIVDLLFVLYSSRPRVKRFRVFGGMTLMTVAARDRHGSWVVVTSIERDIDSFEVELYEVGVVRYAKPEEVADIIRVLKGQL